MEPEILLKAKVAERPQDQDEEVDLHAFKILEEKVAELLKAFQEIKRERDTLASALGTEREKSAWLEKKLEFYSQEREKIKTRIDQLLHRLKGVGS